jgi:hypothetical protein
MLLVPSGRTKSQLHSLRPAGCQQLYSLLSDDLALMYVISVAHHALKAMASRVALGRMAHGKKWYTMGLFMVKDELCYKDAR